MSRLKIGLSSSGDFSTTFQIRFRKRVRLTHMTITRMMSYVYQASWVDRKRGDGEMFYPLFLYETKVRSKDGRSTINRTSKFDIRYSKIDSSIYERLAS